MLTKAHSADVVERSFYLKLIRFLIRTFAICSIFVSQEFEFSSRVLLDKMCTFDTL